MSGVALQHQIVGGLPAGAFGGRRLSNDFTSPRREASLLDLSRASCPAFFLPQLGRELAVRSAPSPARPPRARSRAADAAAGAPRPARRSTSPPPRWPR